MLRPPASLRRPASVRPGSFVPVNAAGERCALNCFFTPPAHLLRPGDARLVCWLFPLRVFPGGHRPASPSLRLVAAPTRPVPPAVHPRRPRSFVAGAGPGRPACLFPSGLSCLLGRRLSPRSRCVFAGAAAEPYTAAFSPCAKRPGCSLRRLPRRRHRGVPFLALCLRTALFGCHAAAAGAWAKDAGPMRRLNRQPGP